MNPLENVNFFKVAAIGIVTGVFSGVFGIGGGLVLIPMLVFFFAFPQKVASATSLTDKFAFSRACLRISPVCFIVRATLAFLWLWRHIYFLGIP